MEIACRNQQIIHSQWDESL
jgi:hypothetical protein